jgi:hypothetical protein
VAVGAGDDVTVGVVAGVAVEDAVAGATVTGWTVAVGAAACCACPAQALSRSASGNQRHTACKMSGLEPFMSKRYLPLHVWCIARRIDGWDRVLLGLILLLLASKWSLYRLERGVRSSKNVKRYETSLDEQET